MLSGKRKDTDTTVTQKVKRLKASLSYQPIVTSDTPVVPTAPALPEWNQVIANTRLNITLREHQSRVVNFMKQNGVRGLLVWHGMGTGKTEVAITTAHALGMKAIVVATASTLTQWKERVKKLGAKGFYFYTADSFMDQGIRKCGSDYILIVDEVQRFRNEEGVKAMSILECASKAGKVLLLTGTPIMNTPRDIAAYINMITTQDTLPTKRKDWDAKFGADGMKDLDELHQLLHCRFSYYLQDDNNPYFPQVVYENVEIEMSPEHQEYYTRVEQADLASLSPLERQNLLGSIEVDINVQAFFNGVRRVSNLASVNPEKKQVYLPKIKAIAQAVVTEIRRGQSGNGPPARQMVYSYFLKNGLDPLQQMIRFLIDRAVKAGTLKPATVARIDGSTTEHNRSLIQRQYNDGKIDVLLFSGAGGTGMDMKDTSVMYFLERDWLNANISQAIHRGARMNSHTPTKDGQRGVMKVIFYELTKRKGTVQEGDLPSIDTYMRQLNERKEAVNMTFIKAIIGDSIESQQKCMTQDVKRVNPPKLLEKVISGQATVVTGPPPPYVPGPSTTLEKLKETVERYGLTVDPSLWRKSVKEISDELMLKIWPASCFGEQWDIKKILSVGSSGAVYLICKKEDCSRVSKLQLIDDKEYTIQLNDKIRVKTVSMDEIEKEYKLQSQAGSLAPRIYVVKRCKLKTGPDSYRTVINIEMEKYDGNLLDYWKTNQAMLQVGDKLTEQGKQLVRLLVGKVKQLNKLGIVHHDMHLKNILYKQVGDGVKFVIGDYGWATKGGESKDVATLLSQLHKQTKVSIPELKQALK